MPIVFVTDTLTTPTSFAGVVAVICVSDTTVKLVAEVLPKVTAEVPVKPEPLMVTKVPPVNGPTLGEIEAMEGVEP